MANKIWKDNKDGTYLKGNMKVELVNNAGALGCESCYFNSLCGTKDVSTINELPCCSETGDHFVEVKDG